MKFKKKTVLFGAILALGALTTQSMLGMDDDRQYKEPFDPYNGNSSEEEEVSQYYHSYKVDEKEEEKFPTTPTKGPVVSFKQFLETPIKPKMVDEEGKNKFPFPQLSRINYFKNLRRANPRCLRFTKEDKERRLRKYGFVQTKRKIFNNLKKFTESCGLENAGFEEYGYLHLTVMLPDILEKNVLLTFEPKNQNEGFKRKRRNKGNGENRGNNGLSKTLF